MKPAVVQLGAGPVQRGLISRIVEAGLVAIVVDRAESPAGLVPNAVHVRAPIDDARAIVEQLGRQLSGVEPAAVLTSTDLGVTSVPAVADALGLSHSTLDSIEAMDDKDRAKAILSRAGVRVPQGRVGRFPGEISLPDEEREYVVKPVDSSGSRGVRRVRGRHSVDLASRHALQFSDRFLVEECISGEHLDVNGFVFDGRFELVSIAQRFFTDAPICVPIYGGIDGLPEPGRVGRVVEAMQRSVEAFGYRHGPIKADAIDTDEGVVIIELAARFHGDVLSCHVAEAAGLNPAALHWLARLGLCSVPTREPGAGGWFGVFADRAGKIDSIEGLDAFRASPSFRGWIPRLGPGDEVGPPEDNRALVGFGLIGVDTDRSLWAEARHGRSTLEVSLV